MLRNVASTRCHSLSGDVGGADASLVFDGEGRGFDAAELGERLDAANEAEDDALVESKLGIALG